jgi:hypothetical protein
MTEYLVVLTCIAIAAITLLALFGGQIKEGVRRSAMAIGGNDSGGSASAIAGGGLAGAGGVTSGADPVSMIGGSSDAPITGGGISGGGGLGISGGGGLGGESPSSNEGSSTETQHFSLKDSSVILTPEGERMAREIADAYFKETGKDIVITDGTRTATDQAARFYDKLQAGESMSIYKNQDAAKEIEDAYTRSIQARKGSAEVIQEMSKVIQAQVDKGVYISRHLESRGFDVRFSDMTQSQKDSFKKAARLVIGTDPVVENDHFHIQY